MKFQAGWSDEFNSYQINVLDRDSNTHQFLFALDDTGAFCVNFRDLTTKKVVARTYNSFKKRFGIESASRAANDLSQALAPWELKKHKEFVLTK